MRTPVALTLAATLLAAAAHAQPAPEPVPSEGSSLPGARADGEGARSAEAPRIASPNEADAAPSGGGASDTLAVDGKGAAQGGGKRGAEAPAADETTGTPPDEGGPPSDPPRGAASAEGQAAGTLAKTPADGAAGTVDAVTTPPDPQTLPRDTVVVVTSTGVHRFSVEIADDTVERAQGLMFRPSMAQDAGMLFDFGAEDVRAFWMKNTLIPLDIIYADETGEVVSIARGEPLSLESIPSGAPARFVLEVNAGVAEAIGLSPGDRLLHRRVAD